MPAHRKHESAQDRMRSRDKRRRDRRREELAQWRRKPVASVLSSSTVEAIALYRLERSKARPQNGGTSGRHPISWSMGPGALR